MDSTKHRRKRPMLTASAVRYDEKDKSEVIAKDFHAISIHTTTSGRRRSDSGGRGESWMTKVTSAMSHRIFSGRRLSASRSTQVMPMFTNHNSSGDVAVDDKKVMRQVSSEHSLGRTAVPHANVEDASCPSFVCEIAPDDGDEIDDRPGTHGGFKPTGSLGIHVQSIQKRSTAPRQGDKVVPSRKTPDPPPELERPLVPTRLLVVQQQCRTKVEELDEEQEEQEEGGGQRGRGRTEEPALGTAAPILKDFFSRSATSAQQERQRQRLVRRERHYRERLARHDQRRTERELEEQAAVELARRTRVEVARRLNQQRRQRLRDEAAVARELLAMTAEAEHEQFLGERERWEGEFQAEMRVLSSALRRAQARKQPPALDSSGAERPMTVAGLAVPVALSELLREGSNYEKRMKTAVPRRREGVGDDALPKSCEIWEAGQDPIEDSVEFHLEPDDDETKRLRREREQLLRRLNEIEITLEARNQSQEEDEQTRAVEPEDGFFI